MTLTDTLQNLGWRPFFASQLDEDAANAPRPARVLAVHRSRLELAGDDVPEYVELSSAAAELHITVGDWVLVDSANPRIVSVLDRFGVFKRRSAGTASTTQMIAANVDILFIVTSANRDFNVARLERYLTLAHDAGAYPIVVITKADLVGAVDEYIAAASKLSPGLVVEVLDARSSDAVDVLRSWCGPGQTVAVLGSSGVGKSTLINSLADVRQQTRQVRDDDQRGRHTTTGRSMHALPAGGWLIDTPGMRELQLVDVGGALDDVFADVTGFAADCRFTDCSHETEPGCAVRAAIDADLLDVDRLLRYRKLLSEERRNTESVAERRSRDKYFGKLYKSVQTEMRNRKVDKQ